MDSFLTTLNASTPSFDGGGIAHAAFLERIREDPESGEARIALAAFLTLRLIDHFTTEKWDQHLDPAFWYQHGAVGRHLEQLGVQLGQDDPELNHLVGLVKSAGGAKRRGTTAALVPALLAYSFYLERELSLRESLDVLQLVTHLIDGRKVSSEAVACALALGRTHRKLTNFDEAEAAYEAAGRLARKMRDVHSGFLSRLGLAAVRWRRGNLPEALRQLEAIRDDASAAGDAQAVAFAEHDLGVVLSLMERPAEAIQHTFRAFGLYQDAEHRAWALHDVGVMLEKLGDHRAANNAFVVVTREARSIDARANALIELMQVAAATHDRLAFAKWRKQCRELEPRLTPELQSDFYLAMGNALARFGKKEEGGGWLDRALEIAREARMHELEFRIQEAIDALRTPQPPAASPAEKSAESSSEWAATRDVAASLEHLAHAEA